MKLPLPPMTDADVPRPVAYAIRHRVAPVKAFRLYAGITSERLATEACLPYHRILGIESGQSMSNVEAERLSETLAVPISILRGKDKTSPATR